MPHLVILYSGQLEAVKIGGRVLTSAAAIRRWIYRINERWRLENPPVDSTVGSSNG